MQPERRPIRRRKLLQLVVLVALVAVAPLRARGAALQLHSHRGAVRGARARAALVHGAVRLRAPDDLALRDASVARFSSGKKKTPSEPGNHADYGLKGTASNDAGAGGRLARAVAGGAGPARGTHHARVQLSLAFRGVAFPRRRRVGSRRVLDRGRHGDLRWHGRLSGVCEPRRRGPGVSRLESRWNATRGRCGLSGTTRRVAERIPRGAR